MATGSSFPDPARVGAIVVAAGASSRMGGVDKTLAPLGGEPLIARTVAAFERSPHVGSVVLMVAERNVKAVRELAAERGWTKLAGVFAGGER
ncbi:MAG: NTP transferase domain-containing protein, partial [Chloroflexi bacterium]|nr:NTP transferase domain-containing protein [Chloroflexota bacterium]